MPKTSPTSAGAPEAPAGPSGLTPEPHPGPDSTGPAGAVAAGWSTATPQRHITRPGNRASDLLIAVGRQALDATLSRFYSTWVYGQTLRGPMPDHMVLYPLELRPGRVDKADAMFQGRYFLPGGQVRTNGLSPFDIEPPGESWAEELHGFSWLRHFTTAGGDAARAHARKLIEDWIDRQDRWDRLAWRPHVIGRRLISWVSNGDLIMDGSDLIYRSALLRNMARQARHLARTATTAPAGEPRFTAAAGLVFSGLCLSEGKRRLDKGLTLLCHEIEAQILPDGGHISRNPAAHLSILLDLLSLREALTRRGLDVPKQIRNAVDRMMPMLRFFRHGDGRLALFNGANEGPDGAIDAALARDDAKGRPFGFAPHSGYQRLTAGPTYLLVDTGPPPPGRYSHDAHAGCLSFEMSVGRCRLVVNCGAARMFGPDWQAASRATAAHSTVTFADTSSARFLAGPISRSLLGERILAGPSRVESRRNESGPDDKTGGIWLDASHNGYEKNFGLMHRRRLFLDRTGEDLRGEDLLWQTGTPPRPALWSPAFWRKAEPPDGFAIRFHLHPDARASLAHDGANVLVLLPNGDGWQFRARLPGGDASIHLEPSVYLGSGDTTRRAEQIVVTGHLFRGEASVKWAWRRLSTRNAGRPRDKDDEDEVPQLPGTQGPTQ